MTDEPFEEAYRKARSIESIAAYGVSDYELEYIGSDIRSPLNEGKGWHVFDYYRDKEGRWWYGIRVLLPDGEVVSMEKYLFGREIKPKGRRQRSEANRS